MPSQYILEIVHSIDDTVEQKLLLLNGIQNLCVYILSSVSRVALKHFFVFKLCDVCQLFFTNSFFKCCELKYWQIAHYPYFLDICISQSYKFYVEIILE